MGGAGYEGVGIVNLAGARTEIKMESLGSHLFKRDSQSGVVFLFYKIFLLVFRERRREERNIHVSNISVASRTCPGWEPNMKLRHVP